LLSFEDPRNINPEDAIDRWNAYHTDPTFQRNKKVKSHLSDTLHQLTDISSFMKRFKWHLTYEYNKSHETHGTLWEERYFSSIVQRGWALVNCAAYIDLNGFRASLARRPEEYKYCSLYALKHRNSDNLIDTDLHEQGMYLAREYKKTIPDPKKYYTKFFDLYQAYVYITGIVPHKDKNGAIPKHGIVITSAMMKELKKGNMHHSSGIFAHKEPCFSFAKFNGSKDFVEAGYEAYFAKELYGDAKENHKNDWIHAIGTVTMSLAHISNFPKRELNESKNIGKKTSFNKKQEKSTNKHKENPGTDTSGNKSSP
jgi:hypothetical protein